MNFEYCSGLQPLDSDPECDPICADFCPGAVTCDLPLIDFEGNFIYVPQDQPAEDQITPLSTATFPGSPQMTGDRKGIIGRLSHAERMMKLQRYREKRGRRVWKRRVNYACRKKVADGRVRVKGRFVKKEDAARMELQYKKPE